MMTIRAKSYSDAVIQLAKHYNKKAKLIYKLEGSNMYMCKNIEELEPIYRELNTTKAIQKLLPSWTDKF